MNRARPEGPKEGIYLDAVLDAVGDRVEDRIDRIQARRRTRSRALVAALSATTLVGGAATAAALTFAVGPGASPAARVTLDVRCVAASDPTAEAYFVARFRIPESEVDRAVPEALCAAAWDVAAARPELAEATPDRLLATAAELARRTFAPREADGTPEVPLEVQAESAAFITPPPGIAAPLAWAVCGPAPSPIVLLGPVGGPSSLPEGCTRTRGTR